MTAWEEFQADVLNPPFFAKAICAGIDDPDLFFPNPSGSAQEARAICARCPVADECREWAMDQGDIPGVWGGTSQYERRVAQGRRPRLEGTVGVSKVARDRRLRLLKRRALIEQGPALAAPILNMNKRTLERDLAWLREEGFL